MVLFSIGHSTRPLEEFFVLLQEYKIERVVDVRTIPKSRRFPWFNKEALASELKKINIAYLSLPELGGLRHPKKDSINLGWRNAGFRGFADYMQTMEFFTGLKLLNSYVKKQNVVVMCAEAVPWRCHRSLIADAEVARGVKVVHIISKSSLLPHELTPFAKVEKDKRPILVYYPASTKKKKKKQPPHQQG